MQIDFKHIFAEVSEEVGLLMFLKPATVCTCGLHSWLYTDLLVVIE